MESTTEKETKETEKEGWIAPGVYCKCGHDGEIEIEIVRDRFFVNLELPYRNAKALREALDVAIDKSEKFIPGN